MVYYRSVQLQGLDIFYREAGNPAKLALVLLGGLPSSSHYFRASIATPEDRFHLRRGYTPEMWRERCS